MLLNPLMIGKVAEDNDAGPRVPMFQVMSHDTICGQICRVLQHARQYN